ncbi:MAG: hypothetical protein MJY85_01710 [Fibrobacter sp.]|nr:hypothetical protein [Fibrobacter sp.]
MKKLCFLFVFAALLTSCIFDSDDAGVSSWLSDHGLPDSYKVHVFDIENIKPSSVEFGKNVAPRLIDSMEFFLGKSAGVSYDMYMDVAFAADTTFIKSLKAADSTNTFMSFFWFWKLYNNKNFPKDSLPFKEDMNVQVSWKLEFSEKKKFLDSLSKISDSVWLASLSDWEADDSDEAVFEISMKKGDSTTFMYLPSKLTEQLSKMTYAAHLQLKLSAPKAEHLYCFFGNVSSSFAPRFNFYTVGDSVNYLKPSPPPYRAANVLVYDEDECETCLHGGSRDSVVISIPSEQILPAIQEFYEKYPLDNKGDGYDVRQTVVLAQLTMARDDAASSNATEFGLPIQVVVGSFVDSAGTEVRRMESYRLNKERILEDGHQNLIFHEGDSLSLQITGGLRELVNLEKDSLKIVVKMGYPFLQEKDSTYTDYIANGDTNYVFMNYFDHGRYDFSKSLENPMTLKLWMSSKRKEEN